MRGKLRDRWAGREGNQELDFGQDNLEMPERHASEVPRGQLEP